MFSDSPPSQSVHGRKQIDMAQHQRKLEQDEAVHILVHIIQDMLKDTFEDETSKLTETFELRLQSFKRELVQEQSSFMESAVKKFKSDPYIFKSDGNKRQFQHQEKLMENLMEVSHAISKKDTTTASQKAEEGMTLIRNRMKRIKIADRSQFGWKAAEEYQQDDLASGSEDENVSFDRRDVQNRKSSKGVMQLTEPDTKSQVQFNIAILKRRI